MAALMRILREPAKRAVCTSRAFATDARMRALVAPAGMLCKSWNFVAGTWIWMSTRSSRGPEIRLL